MTRSTQGTETSSAALDDAVELARKLAESRSSGKRGPARDPYAQFRVRRFAGAAAHKSSLAHLRVAHLTDLHVGLVTPMNVQRAAVEITNATQPDLVAITGDFVCHSQVYLDALVEVVEGFSAPVVCVLGNHDHWSGGNEVRRALHRAGAEVLDNANTTITLRHEQLQLVGLDDAYTGHASRERAVKGLRPGVATLGLSHIAEEADGLWHAGVPLVLSGHTHAGQVTLAKLHEFAIGRLVGHRYVHGLYGTRGGNGAAKAEVDGAVYVGAGVGAAVVPLRLGDRGRREITLFELGHEPGSFDEHHPEQVPLPGRKPSEKKEYLRAMAAEAKRVKREKRAERASQRGERKRADDR